MRLYSHADKDGGFFAAVRQTIRRLLHGLEMDGHYRPERHYMRGAGPKSGRMSNGYGILSKNKDRKSDGA